MRQLARRIQRLESTGTFVDLHRSFNRVLHEAALEVDLPPIRRQQLVTAIDARLHALSQILPAYFTNERQIDTVVREVCQAVHAVVDEPQRYGLYAALSQACIHEARRRGVPVWGALRLLLGWNASKCGRPVPFQSNSSNQWC